MKSQLANKKPKKKTYDFFVCLFVCFCGARDQTQDPEHTRQELPLSYISSLQSHDFLKIVVKGFC
jgi:hypothetical protein